MVSTGAEHGDHGVGLLPFAGALVLVALTLATIWRKVRPRPAPDATSVGVATDEQ